MSYRGPTNSLASIELANLGSLAETGHRRSSTCIAFSSDIWRPVSQSSASREAPEDTETEMAIRMDGWRLRRLTRQPRGLDPEEQGGASGFFQSRLEPGGARLGLDKAAFFSLVFFCKSSNFSAGERRDETAHPCKERSNCGGGVPWNIAGLHSIELLCPQRRLTMRAGL